MRACAGLHTNLCKATQGEPSRRRPFTRVSRHTCCTPNGGRDHTPFTACPAMPARRPRHTLSARRDRPGEPHHVSCCCPWQAAVELIVDAASRGSSTDPLPLLQTSTSRKCSTSRTIWRDFLPGRPGLFPWTCLLLDMSSPGHGCVRGGDRRVVRGGGRKGRARRPGRRPRPPAVAGDPAARTAEQAHPAPLNPPGVGPPGPGRSQTWHAPGAVSSCVVLRVRLSYSSDATRRSGGMAYAGDSKSPALTGLWVRVPPPAPTNGPTGPPVGLGPEWARVGQVQRRAR